MTVVSKSFNDLNCYRFDHPNIIAGQGTTGLEILEQVPDVDAVVIPTGGGGLLAGCAVALKTMKPSVKIIVSFHSYSNNLDKNNMEKRQLPCMNTTIPTGRNVARAKVFTWIQLS